jgi:hypothetical protein
MLLQGKSAEPLPLLLKGHNSFRAGGAELTLPFEFSILAQAYMGGARYEDAHSAIDKGLAIVQKNDERCQEAEMYRIKGELVLAESPDQAGVAEGYFHQALETARCQQSRAWELRATMSIARLWEKLGRRDEARAALTAVYDKYTEGFTTPDLVDARALLTALA